MTEKQLRAKLSECLKEDKEIIPNLIDKIIKSGCLNIEGAEDNFIIPKAILCAIYREMAYGYEPMSAEGKANVKNILPFL